MGFNAPRIIGGGQIQQPVQVDPLSKVNDAVKWAEERRESDRRYDTDRFDAAQDRNLAEKWRLQMHRGQAFKEYEQSPEYDSDGNKMPFDEWYNKRYPDIQSQLSQTQMKNDYDQWMQAHQIQRTHPWIQGMKIVNPFTGQIDKISKDMRNIGSGIIGSLASLLGQGQSTVPPTTTTTVPDPNIDYSGDTLIDEDTGSSEEFDNLKRGSYIPGNETGDTNPAMLEDGEYVLNRNAVKKLGKGFLDYINNEAYPRFQSGGFMDPGASGGVGRVVGPVQVENNLFDNLKKQKQGQQGQGGEGGGDAEMMMQLMKLFAGGMQTGGFMAPGATGSGGSIANPNLIESNLFDALKKQNPQGNNQVRTDLGGEFDYGSLAGSGMTGSEYDALVQSRNEGWDPNWDDDDDWQEGGYIKPKGYRKGGSIANPYDTQEYATQEDWDRYEQSLRKNYYDDFARQIESDLDYKDDLEKLWAYQDKQIKKSTGEGRTTWYNPTTWLNYPTQVAMDFGRSLFGYDTLADIRNRQLAEANQWTKTRRPTDLRTNPGESFERDQFYQTTIEETNEDLIDKFRQVQ